ncbi:IS66 family insertion sequence element accessory protein TnpB [Pedobacter nutrimenti]|uniref:IS66 family insertion sequence element accessory protein TnpB n=1 Tax=Pedobacter nutrimenti TaxID=1241337 RepID=UPI00292CDC26|nr:IS66 family insertion sequence element accessory protein TnpB [Pedobacter nutrimenti]
MEKLIKLTNNPLFQMFIGDKAFRVYRKEVDGRLGMPGLSKLVVKATGSALKEEEAYIFAIRNQNAIKILTRDHRSTSMVEVYDEHARGLKEECIAFGLL